MVVFAFTPLVAKLPRSKYAQTRLRLTYVDGRGVLRLALAECTGMHTVLNDEANSLAF